MVGTRAVPSNSSNAVLDSKLELSNFFTTRVCA